MGGVTIKTGIKVAFDEMSVEQNGDTHCCWPLNLEGLLLVACRLGVWFLKPTYPLWNHLYREGRPCLRAHIFNQ